MTYLINQFAIQKELRCSRLLNRQGKGFTLQRRIDFQVQPQPENRGIFQLFQTHYILYRINGCPLAIIKTGPGPVWLIARVEFPAFI
ncbi:hypothetical protein [Spirosoma arcticum]